MKPAPFDYVAPADIDGVLEALAGPDAKIIAGGQSLVPMLNLRLARPALLVDITRVPRLAHLRREAGALRIGATTTHRELAESPMIAAHWPLLQFAAQHIGHDAIRNVGTIGGSVAHADPAAELPAALLALEASMTIVSKSGSRSVAARDFFRGYLQTALGPNELLTEIVVPPTRPYARSAFAEVTRRHGDFALAGVAVQLDPSPAARVVLFGAGDVPLRATAAEALLVSSGLTALDQAADAAVADVHPGDDLHATGEYRRNLLRDLTLHCLQQVATRIEEERC